MATDYSYVSGANNTTTLQRSSNSTHELKGIARLHAAGILRPSTVQGHHDETKANKLKFDELYYKKDKTAAGGTGPLANQVNKIEQLYQHYMKTCMKNYVPKRATDSRDRLHTMSESKTNGSYSFYGPENGVS